MRVLYTLLFLLFYGFSFAQCGETVMVDIDRVELPPEVYPETDYVHFSIEHIGGDVVWEYEGLIVEELNFRVLLAPGEYHFYWLSGGAYIQDPTITVAGGVVGEEWDTEPGHGMLSRPISIYDIPGCPAYVSDTMTITDTVPQTNLPGNGNGYETCPTNSVPNQNQEVNDDTPTSNPLSLIMLNDLGDGLGYNLSWGRLLFNLDLDHIYFYHSSGQQVKEVSNYEAYSGINFADFETERTYYFVVQKGEKTWSKGFQIRSNRFY